MRFVGWLSAAGACVLLAAPVEAKVFDVRDFGAKGDGVQKDTLAIQAAVDAAAGNGGGVVDVPAGKYLTGSIFLKSGVEFHVGAGAEIFASPDPGDYNRLDVCPQNQEKFYDRKVENVSGGHLFLAIEQTNVTMSGRGVVNGNSAAFLVDPSTGTNWPGVHAGIKWRPAQMLYFVECEKVRLEGLQLRNSPYWTCFLHGCRDVQVRGLDIHTTRAPRSWNGDGIDIDCCQDVIVSDCKIDTDDDCITLRANDALLKRKQDCARVTVANCVLSSHCNAVRLGVGDGRVHDAVFSNLVIHDSRTAVHVVSCFWSGRGTDVTDVSFNNLVLNRCECFCRIRHGNTDRAEIGRIRFSGVSGRTTEKSIVWSNSRNPFGRIVFDQVDVGDAPLEVVGTDNVVVRDSSLRESRFSEPERRRLEREIDAGKTPSWSY